MYEQISPDTSHIRYEETDLSYLKLRPYRFKCGIYLICIQGKSIISTGVQQYAFDEQTELIFLTGSLIQIIQASADFKVRILLFPKDVFLKAILPIDTPYFNYVHEHPHYHHTADERSQNTWREIVLWMDVAQMLLKNNNTLLFRKQQELNFLQSILMWLFNTIPEKLAANKQYSRKQMLCHQFMQLIREHSTCEHQVPFYTEQLCITPLLLSAVKNINIFWSCNRLFCRDCRHWKVFLRGGVPRLPRFVCGQIQHRSIRQWLFGLLHRPAFLRNRNLWIFLFLCL